MSTAAPPPEQVAQDVRLGRVEGVVTVTIGEQSTRYVPADAYLPMVEERDQLRRALALVSAARVPGSGIDAGKVLLSVGESYEQARTTAGIIAGL